MRCWLIHFEAMGEKTKLDRKREISLLEFCLETLVSWFRMFLLGLQSYSETTGRESI